VFSADYAEQYAQIKDCKPQEKERRAGRLDSTTTNCVRGACLCIEANDWMRSELYGRDWILDADGYFKVEE
jgi:hypothetical protein